MTNGSAALHLVPAPEYPSKDTPAGPSTDIQEGTEVSIGQATAAAACAICLGASEHMDGGVSTTTRAAGGERIAQLYFLQQAYMGDFAAVAREQGAKVLRTYLTTDDFNWQHSADASEYMIDLALTTVLDVLARVTAAERAWH